MKTYLIREYELRRFKAEYLTFTPANTDGSEFIIKAWISTISDDGKTLKAIVSDEKPAILFSAPAQIPLEPRGEGADEHETESRKDTLWGDLKLLTKKAIREGKHRVEHYQEVRAQSIVAPVNLTIALRGAAMDKTLKSGEAYYFRLLADSSGGSGGYIVGSVASLFDSAYPVVRSDFFSEDPPINVYGGFVDFISARTRRKMLKAIAIVCVIIPSCIYISKQASVSEQERVEHESRLKQQKELADRRFDELIKKREDGMAKLKDILERRGDIGLLVASTSVEWGGRGGPVTINSDGTWTEEKNHLAIWPQSNWQSIPYGYRLSGLKKICGIWRKIWGPDKNGEAEVRLFQDPADKEQAPIGGCKREEDAWLSKTVAQVAEEPPESRGRRPAHRRKWR